MQICNYVVHKNQNKQEQDLGNGLVTFGIGCLPMTEESCLHLGDGWQESSNNQHNLVKLFMKGHSQFH